MNRLIICEGNSDFWIDGYPGDTYIYRIRGVGVSEGSSIEINDPCRLNAIAEEVRDDYSAWVNKFASEYSGAPYELWDHSVFHYSDLSCKRTEIFDTFNTICNLLLIMEKLRGIDINEVHSIEIGSDICCAVESLFSGARFKRKRVVINRWRRIRDLASDIRFTIYTSIIFPTLRFWIAQLYSFIALRFCSL